MSEFSIITPIDPAASRPEWERRVRGLTRHLQLAGGQMWDSVHRVRSSWFVTSSTISPDRSFRQCHDDLFRTTGARWITDGASVIETPRVTGRTIWRIQADAVEVLTTSLRAAAFLAGDVEADPAATAWMLVTGSLGPQRSWDRRCRQLAPSMRHHVGTSRDEPRAAPPTDLSEADPERLRRELGDRIAAGVSELALDPDEWALPLSGGVDSRGLALALGAMLSSFTYGDVTTLADASSDLAVAVRVADRLGLRHRVLPFDRAAAPIADVLDRFVVASEGRTENIAGYGDGMQLWRELRAEGIAGIVRGDEVFGWVHRFDATSCRTSTGALVAGDLAVPGPLREAFAVLGDEMAVPSWMVQRAGESSADLRDRLYRRFRVPSILAALTQTKSAYVDVTSPFLADPVVELVLQLPERFRTDKKLFREMVVAGAPGLPFAERASIPPSLNLLSDTRAVAVLQERIAASEVPGLPDAVRELVLAPLVTPAERRRNPMLVDTVRRVLPHSLRRAVARRQLRGPVRVDAGQLRFRAFLAAAGLQTVQSSAAAGRAAGSCR